FVAGHRREDVQQHQNGERAGDEDRGANVSRVPEVGHAESSAGQKQPGESQDEIVNLRTNGRTTLRSLRRACQARRARRPSWTISVELSSARALETRSSAPRL